MSCSFEPPADYKKINLNSKPKGEELWLVQLPPKVDLSQIKSLNLNDTFKIGKKTYSVEDSEQTRKVNTLVPKDESNGEELKMGKSISRTLTLTQQFEIPEIDYDKVTVPKPVVEQKQGLQMRYYPTGYGPEPTNKTTTTNASPKRTAASDEPSPKKHKKEKKEKSSGKKDKKKKSKE